MQALMKMLMAKEAADKSELGDAWMRAGSADRSWEAMAADGTSPAAAATPRSRLPRWTRHETIVLIQAKRATERRAGLPPVRLKWAVVSAYCRRRGVERGPMHCRKRWGNLSWDLKKIVAWEENAGAGAVPAPPLQRESFWDMRGDQRRARQLPSSFDREVYDALVGAAAAADELDPADCTDAPPPPPPPFMAVPMSARRTHVPPASSQHECSDDPGTIPPASDKNSTSQQDSEATFGTGAGAPPPATSATASIAKQVAEALERGNRALAEQLEAKRASWDTDREHRRALLAAVNRLADAVGRIAGKL